MNHGYTYHDNISRNDAGETVLEYYLHRYGHSTRDEWMAHFAAGRIHRNGAAAAPDERLAAGDRLAYHRPPWQEPDVPTAIPLIDAGEGWMAFAKPSGLPVLPGGGYLEHTMLHILRARYGDDLAPVHRLGRGTSGAMLFSSDPAAAALAAAMRERRIRKTYLALVQGIPAEDAFVVDTPIGRVPHSLLGTVWAASPDGKPSESRCTVLRRNDAEGTSLLEVDIPTGRPHQIRIHCAAAGFPLAGDPLYGPGGTPPDPSDGVPGSEGRTPGHERPAVPGDCGYFLHSWKIRFPDPATGSAHVVTAAPPDILAPTDH